MFSQPVHLLSPSSLSLSLIFFYPVRVHVYTVDGSGGYDDDGSGGYDEDEYERWLNRLL